MKSPTLTDERRQRPIANVVHQSKPSPPRRPPARSAQRGLVLGQNPPEIAYWERGEWWLAGDARPWQPDAVNVLSDKLVFKPRLAPVARRDLWHP